MRYKILSPGVGARHCRALVEKRYILFNQVNRIGGISPAIKPKDVIF